MNIDIELWKEIQEKFSKEIGISIRTMDLEDNIIVKSGEIPYIMELISKKRPDIINRPNGLMNITRPMLLHGEQIGIITCGPIGIDSNYDFSILAEKLGMEQEEVEQALTEIKNLSQEEINIYKKIITILSESMPKLAFRQKTRDNQVRKLSILYDLTKKINSTIELKEILFYVMESLVKALDADDCAIILNNNKYYLHESCPRCKKIILPLQSKNQIVGELHLYLKGDNLTEENKQFMTIITNEIAMALSNAQKYEEAKDLAVNDKLTGLFTKRHFSELLEKRAKEIIDKDNPISIILLDIDNFGKYNNAHGHLKGDDLLSEISKIIKDTVGDKGIAGRYGGEEFILMLNTNPKETIGTAQRIRERIEKQSFYGEDITGQLTVSLGLVICLNKISAIESIKEADEALYKAKNKGKNQVVHKVWLGRGLKTEITS